MRWATNTSTRWHTWFAVYPVYCEGYGWVWLETVYVRRVTTGTDDLLEYQLV